MGGTRSAGTAHGRTAAERRALVTRVALLPGAGCLSRLFPCAGGQGGGAGTSGAETGTASLLGPWRKEPRRGGTAPRPENEICLRTYARMTASLLSLDPSPKRTGERLVSHIGEVSHEPIGSGGISRELNDHSAAIEWRIRAAANSASSCRRRPHRIFPASLFLRPSARVTQPSSRSFMY